MCVAVWPWRALSQICRFDFGSAPGRSPGGLDRKPTEVFFVYPPSAEGKHPLHYKSARCACIAFVCGRFSAGLSQGNEAKGLIGGSEMSSSNPKAVRSGTQGRRYLPFHSSTQFPANQSLLPEPVPGLGGSGAPPWL